MKNTEQRQRILENLVYAWQIIVFAVPYCTSTEKQTFWDDIMRNG
ncbi:MAG: hypothetical protein ACLSDJ_06215 [Butyricimonas faecihominis]